ncbi:hypothetical protein CHUAL_004629 [Chamberlinius hualienensis]
MDVIEFKPLVPSVYDQALCFSKLTLEWARKVLWKTHKGSYVDINEDAPKKMKANSLRELVIKRTKGKSNYNLLNVFCQLFTFEYLMVALIMFIRFTALKLIGIYFMGLLINSLSSTAADDLLWYHRYVSSAVIVVTILIGVPLPFLTEYGAEKLGAKIRIASSSLVFDKLLRISTAEMKRINIGYVVNLFTSDVSKFEDFATLIFPSIIAPVSYNRLRGLFAIADRNAKCHRLYLYHINWANYDLLYQDF